MHELAKLPYESRLKKLKIYSLYYRQQQGDLIETYKLLKGYYDLDWTRFFTLSPVHNTSDHHMKLYKKHSRLQLRENFYTESYQHVELLLEAVVSSSTLSTWISNKNLMSFVIAQDMDNMYKGLVPKLYFWLYNWHVYPFLN